jgi:hypothetical protein
MNIAQAIIHLFPQANPLMDFIVQDDSDGEGPYIAQWNMEEDQPTEEELQAAWLDLTTLKIEDVKVEKISTLNEECNKIILAGFTSSAVGVLHQYGFDYEDQSNLMGTLTLFNSNPALTEIEWKTKDAGLVLHTREQLVQLCTDSFTHKQNNIKKYWIKKQQVLDAISIEEINSITFE